MTENPEFLSEQLITYIGNKRSLLPFIGEGISFVQEKLGKEKLSCLDVFAGSGVVSRYLKQFASSLCVNDLELYSKIINSCYLSNRSEIDEIKLKSIHENILDNVESRMNEMGQGVVPGFISELYAPKDVFDIKKGERCFYTTRNANYIDFVSQEIISLVPSELRHFFVAPLLSQVSVHANTAGIFKGFYKNSKTGIGQFGGNGKNALNRIQGHIKLPYPLFSNFECPVKVLNMEANEMAESESVYADVDEGCFDLVYIDPPYNQHPYGSNYFMLNLVASYERPDTELISRISGIPKDWNRSNYNKRRFAANVFENLVANLRAKFLLVSFNSEGFISRKEMESLLGRYGKVTVFESNYNAFRGSRNLHGRDIHVSEFLFVLEKKA